MSKRISSDFKEKLKYFLIIFLVVLGKVFFETLGRGSVDPLVVLLEVLLSLAFSYFIFTAVDLKDFSLTSLQNIFAIIMIIFTLGVMISYRFISFGMFFAVLLSSVMVLLAQRFYLVPIAVSVAFFISLLDGKSYLQSNAMSCIPAAISVSCVFLSAQIKESALWKKLVFTASQVAMIASVIRVYYKYRFAMTVHSFFAQKWDTIASFVSVIILLILVVYTIKKKRCIGEAFGYFSAAAFAVPSMFMDTNFPMVSGMSLLMIITLFGKEGMPAHEIFTKAVDYFKIKLKKN